MEIGDDEDCARMESELGLLGQQAARYQERLAEAEAWLSAFGRNKRAPAESERRAAASDGLSAMRASVDLLGKEAKHAEEELACAWSKLSSAARSPLCTCKQAGPQAHGQFCSRSCEDCQRAPARALEAGWVLMDSVARMRASGALPNVLLLGSFEQPYSVVRNATVHKNGRLCVLAFHGVLAAFAHASLLSGKQLSECAKFAEMMADIFMYADRVTPGMEARSAAEALREGRLPPGMRDPGTLAGLRDGGRTLRAALARKCAEQEARALQALLARADEDGRTR
jgi:hypothetical protein